MAACGDAACASVLAPWPREPRYDNPTDRDPEGLATLVGGAFVPVAGDITDPLMPDRLVDAAVTATGRLDVLVASAGVWETTPLDRLL